MMALKSAVSRHLPKIDDFDLQMVMDHLVDTVGVDEPADLQFIEPDDLPMLKPIQVRKLIQGLKNETSSGETQAEPLSPQQTGSATSSASSSRASSPTAGLAPPTAGLLSPSTSQMGNWARSYSVPWNRFSKPLLQALSKEKRPKSSQRREMIRVLVADIQMEVPKPTKRQLGQIAERIVAKYPASFKDLINGEVVGTGYDSLHKNIVQRVYNQNRNDTEQTTKRSVESEEQSTKRRKPSDEYGCVNFMPKDYPSGHSEETLLEKKSEMKTAHQKGKEVDREGMVTTYILQRHDIVSGDFTTPDLQEEWPFLFSEEGLSAHFECLVGVNAKTTLQQAIEKKGKTILSFMSACGKQPLQTTLCSIERYKGELGNETPEVPGLVCLLMRYLGEPVDSLIKQMEHTATKDDVVRQKDLPQTPVLIACGEILTAERWMLVIDGHVVAGYIPDFLTALAMLFASYYCFGIEYNDGASASLDFIQRCLMKINPEKGSKVKRGSGPHPKVLSLIRNISDHEWSI